MQTLIDDFNKTIDKNLTNNSRTFNSKILKSRDVSKKCHELFEKMVSSSQESV